MQGFALSSLKIICLLAFVLAQTAHACHCEVAESAQGCCHESSSENQQDDDCCSTCFLEREAYTLLAGEALSDPRNSHDKALFSILISDYGTDFVVDRPLVLRLAKKSVNWDYNSNTPRAPPCLIL